MVLVEVCRTGLALGEDSEDCRTAGEYQRFSRVAEGLGHHRYGVTVPGEATRGAFDLTDAGGADNGVHLGGRRSEAGGNRKVAGDRGETRDSQLRGGGVGPGQRQDLVVLLRQLSCDGGPNISGGARDKDLHCVAPSKRRRLSLTSARAALVMGVLSTLVFGTIILQRCDTF